MELVPGTVSGGCGFGLHPGHINVVMLALLVQRLLPLLLIVVIQIGQVVEVAIVDDIDFGVVAAVALRLLCDGCAGCLGEELIKSHVFIELGKVVVLVPLELVGIRAVGVVLLAGQHRFVG